VAIDLNDKPWYVAVIVGAVLGIALFVVLQMYVFKDMQVEIEERQVKIDELQREIEKGLAAKADLPKREEDIKNLELDLDRLRKILPTKRETPALIKRLKQLTERGRLLHRPGLLSGVADSGRGRRDLPRARPAVRPPQPLLADHQRRRPRHLTDRARRRAVHHPCELRAEDVHI